MTEAVKKSYEKAYVKEKYPGSSSTPGSMINALTSANPSQTLKVKIPNSEVGVTVSFIWPVLLPIYNRPLNWGKVWNKHMCMNFFLIL